MNKRQNTRVFLAVLTAVSAVFCYLLLAPFVKAIVFAAVLAVIFYPLYAQIHRWVRSRDVAAALSTTVVAVFIASCSVGLGSSITSGLRNIYRSLSSPGDTTNTLTNYFSRIVERLVGVLSGYVPVSVDDLHAMLAAQAENIVSSLLALTAKMAGSFTSLIVNALISLFILFFLFRDGRPLLRRISVILPMERGQVNRLYDIVRETLNAIVYGTLVIAALQGALTGVAFWLVGITSPVLWGVVTALCALLPIIGTAFVFTPAILVLVFGGDWAKGLLLAAWGLVVVHPTDNLLRPYLIGEKARLSTVYVFFALLGGFEAFGGLGLFVGPVILAVTVSLFAVLRQELKSWKQGERSNLRPLIRSATRRAAPG